MHSPAMEKGPVNGNNNYPHIIQAPKSHEKLHLTTSSMQLENWDQISIEFPQEIAPLVITSEPLPTTTATGSDLIASHVHSREFHSVTAHNP